MTQNKINPAILEHGIDKIDSMIGYDALPEGSDLHHHLYNEDYFIIGTYEAKQFLNDFGVFEAIEIVTDYERDNFGETTTDISNPEKLANMLAYVQGEQALVGCETLQENWDQRLDDDDLKAIKSELEAQR